MNEATVVSGGAGARYARPLFLATILAGSFLLFLTQPMVARMALPRLGGAPAIWNSAMVVYQALLLGGYAYAHYLSRLAPRKQALSHLALFAFAALWLPLGLRDIVLPQDAPAALWAPWLLLSSIGPLFFIVSAQAPLMQRWYALDPARGDPYPLYAASNLGSFAGLLSYPLLVEPMLTLRQQSLLWSAGYGLLVLLVALSALTLRAPAVAAQPVGDAGPAPTWRQMAWWVALAAVPSGLMLSTTTHLTTDIVALPLLWVVPLGLYLLSFVVAFARRRGTADLLTAIAPFLLLIAGGFAFSGGSKSPLFTATLGLLLLFVVAVALHTAMYRARPAVGHLTAFYLAMSVGGVVGGIFCAVIAPDLFDWTYEHPLLLLAAAALVPQKPLLPWAERMPAWLRLAFVAAVFGLSWIADRRPFLWLDDASALGVSVFISLIGLLFVGRRVLFALCLAALMLSYGGWRIVDGSLEPGRTRSYFGVYTISTSNSPPARLLTHGTTLHGIQNLAPGSENEPTSYYARGSGIGHAMASVDVFNGPNPSIGVVGLGTGTLSCYALPGQSWTFFEIDPEMVRIARRSGEFTFLKRCAPQAKIVLGDARISLGRQPPASLDLLAVDAFSSDAVPMHLLTREALAVYRRALKPEGLLMIHISNRYLDLEPVLAAAAQADKWHAAVFDYAPSEAEAARNMNMSVWVALASQEDTLMALKISSAGDAFRWRPIVGRPGFPGWSDDYATIIPLLEDWRNWVPDSLKDVR
ncbi:MAG TPA: fused MFS/spermidine synthase [Allosphingosinicella sp.]